MTEYADPGNKKIKLVIKFSQSAALHLRETPLSEDQKLKDMKDGRVELKATVMLTWQLRWWLLGFGAQVEVIRPKFLREEFVGVTCEMSKIYQ